LYKEKVKKKKKNEALVRWLGVEAVLVVGPLCRAHC
jgi:hypothetical protein